jgi:hypothetical protein
LATFTWVGGTSNEWTTATNWSPQSIPNDPTAVVTVDNPANDADIFNGTAITVGSLSVGGTGISAGQVIVGGSPEIGLGGGGSLTASQSIVVTSTDQNGALVGGPGGVVTSPNITIASGVAIGGGGTYNITTIVNNGLIQADGGAPGLGLGPVIVQGNTISGTGHFEIDHSSILEINAATSQNVAVAVDPTEVANLLLDSPGTFKGGVNLVNPNSQLNLFFKGQTPTGVSYDLQSGSLIVTGAGGILDTIPLSSPNAITSSVVTSTIAGYGEVSINQAAAGFDVTTGQPVAIVANPYTGPVAGLQNEYINVTSHNLNVATATPNWFVHTGSGDDAIEVNSGTNVLDGGTGSNFLTGGSGTDTFFVDDRAATADIWSTVNNLHAGDAATIWGVTAQDFDLNWMDGEGAAGFTGLTLHATAAGKPTASLTLAGYTSADLNNGRLSMSFGTDPASGSAYMYIHGNS